MLLGLLIGFLLGVDLVTEGVEEVGVVRFAPCIEVGLDDRAGANPLRDGAGIDWAVGGDCWELEKSPTKQNNSSTPCESRLSWVPSLVSVSGRD